jgi:hypothetical protein
MFGSNSPVCQSCSMPLSKDPQKGGTELDGSKSTLYCSHCYSSGAFIQPAIKVHEMMELVEDKLYEMWIPRFIGKQFTKNIPHLKRWSGK